MRRLIATLLSLASLVTLAACSSPPNQPCYWHQGYYRSHLSQDGHTLLLICRDGTVLVRHQ